MEKGKKLLFHRGAGIIGWIGVLVIIICMFIGSMNPSLKYPSFYVALFGMGMMGSGLLIRIFLM
jgi:hypothetical protein